MSSVDDLERRLVAFVRAFGLHQTERTPCGEPISVSQAHALTELAAQSLTQAELARRLRLDRSVVSRLADTLSERGWLRRKRHPHDQRAVQLVLTDTGRRAADRLAGARRARMATLLDAVPPDERDNVLQALDVLTRSLTDPATTKVRDEAEAFGQGDFADPASIHGDDMPGLDALEAGYRDIDVRYRDLPDGAEIDYRTDDPELAAAVRDWFDAQLSDHAGDASASAADDHTSHPGHEE